MKTDNSIEVDGYRKPYRSGGSGQNCVEVGTGRVLQAAHDVIGRSGTTAPEAALPEDRPA